MEDEQALDEYSLFENGLDNEKQAYSIGEESKRIILISTLVLFINLLRYTIGPLLPNSFSITGGYNQFYHICTILAESYWYYFILNYFKHYKLKWIIFFTWVMLIADMSSRVISFLSTLSVTVSAVIGDRLLVLNYVGLFVWSIMILCLKNNWYTGIQYFKYSISILIMELVLDTLFYIPLIWVFIDPAYDKYLSLTYLPEILYYYFFLQFILKLKVKHRNS